MKITRSILTLLYLLSGTSLCWLMMGYEKENLVVDPDDYRVSKNNQKGFPIVSQNGEEFVKLSKETIPQQARPFLMMRPTSFKWRTPLYTDFPQAAVSISFHANDQSKERSSFSYSTQLFREHTLPVISLFLEPRHFFDRSSGIYTRGATWDNEGWGRKRNEKWWDHPANYHQRGRKWERPVHVQFLDEKGEVKFESDAGVRIHGNATRAYPQKSLRLLARKEYGNKKWFYPFFGEKGLQNYESLILRNGGNDWDKTLIADGVMHEIAIELGLIGQAAQPCVVYLNGEYWGIHNLRERMDEDYLAERFNVKKKEVVLLEGKDVLVNGNEEDLNDWRQLLRELNTAPIEQREDLLLSRFNQEGLMNYLLLEMFFANTDWPANNVKVFRIRNREDEWGKWNFAVWDMDYGMGYFGPKAISLDMERHIQRYPGNPITIIWKAIQSSESLKAIWEKNKKEKVDGMLSAKHLVEILDEAAAKIKSEMPYQIARWRSHSSIDEWEDYLKERKNFCLERRIRGNKSK